jgi:hypothetical protein
VADDSRDPMAPPAILRGSEHATWATPMPSRRVVFAA